jgi:hypothetical protein
MPQPPHILGPAGVNLEKMNSQKKILWAATLWVDVFFPEHAPHLDHNGQAYDYDNHDGGDNDDDDYKRKVTTSRCGREEQ